MMRVKKSKWILKENWELWNGKFQLAIPTLNNIIRVAILGGLFLLCVNSRNSQAQANDGVATYIENQIESTLNTYYYSSFDSALFHLEPLSQLALDNHLFDLYLGISIEKAYLAWEYQEIDSLQKFISNGNAITRKYEDSLDSKVDLVNELVYLEGMQAYGFGDYKLAIESFEKIIETERKRSAPDSMELFYNYINLGQSYLNIQDFENARLFYNHAKQWLPKSNSQYDAIRDYDYQLAKTSATIGNTFLVQGKSFKSLSISKKSKSYLFSALSVLEHKKDNPSAIQLLSLTYKKIADYYLYVNKKDSAVYYANKMKEIYFPNDTDNMLNNLYLGSVFLESKKYKESLLFFNETKVLAEKVYKGKHFQLGKVQYHLGQWHAAQGNWDKALGFYQNALTQLTDNYAPSDNVYDAKIPTGVTVDNELLQVLLLKAKALAGWYKSDVTKQKQLLASLENYRLAIDLVGQMRNNFLLSESRQFLASKSHEVYENALEVAYQAYQLGLGDQYIEEAFWLMEKNKSNLLLEAVKDAAAKQFVDIPLDIIEKETQIKSKVAYLKRALSKEADNDSKKANQLKNSLFEAQQSYQKFTTELEQSYPKYHQLKYDKQIISLKEVQQLVSKNKALVEYFYGDKNIYVIGISDDKTTLIRLPNNEESLLSFIENIEWNEYTKSNNDSRIKQFSKNGYALYQQLLAPVLAQFDTNVNQLKIIPDGLLGYLPFEILLMHESESEMLTYKNFPYLINDFTVSTEFSATLLKKERVNKVNYEYEYVGFAPSYKGTLMAENYQITRSGETTNMKFSPLKYNEQEVEMGYDIFGGKSFLGDAATEMSFKEYAPKSKIIHLSTHAFANTKNAQFSGLAFVQSDKDGTLENDGLVYIDDLYNMHLNAELTVLSACETAVGEFKRGEGIMSLGRAFKYAGCQNIIMSSWTVSDKSTANLMQYFYEALDEGMGKADALRQAKLRYLESADANTADPYFWAAFTLIGDNEPIVGKWRQHNMLLWFSMAFALVIFGFLLYRRKT